MEIHFILYKPGVPGNVGAAARALKTMGFSRLSLIDPCDHLSDEARMLAHGSNDILENAKVYNDFETCTSDLDFTIGTTAKKRSSKEDYYYPGECLNLLSSKESFIQKTGLIFGTEESGLPNKLLQACDIASTIPLDNPYPSLNLGQSVMLYAYEFSRINKEWEGRPKNISEESFLKLKKRVEALLKVIEIPEDMPLYHRILERVSQLGGSDINLLHSVSSRLNEKLKNSKS